MRMLRPGGPFGPMQIPLFSNESGGPCQISSDIPDEGFSSNTKYNISVSSTVDGGVGLILYPSVGDFEEPTIAGYRPVCTGDNLKVAGQSWVWASPDEKPVVDVAEFFAACSSGRHEESWAALPLVVKRKGFEPQESCNVSRREPQRRICSCGAKQTTCAWGLCCWPDGECKSCDSGADGFSPTTWFWFHAILMLLTWVLLFPNGILLACRHRRSARAMASALAAPLAAADAPSQSVSAPAAAAAPPPASTGIRGHMVMQSAGLALQLVGLVCAVLGVSGTRGVHFSSAHEILGLCVIVLSCLQLLFGVLRPKPTESGRRRVWRRCHRSLGYLLMLGALTTIVLGFFLANSMSLGPMSWFALSMCFFLACCSLVMAFLSSDKCQRSGGHHHGGHDQGQGHSALSSHSRPHSELTNSARDVPTPP
eukprot:CAMPEP_0206432498 /NCGR_PEP_ID=MMETSP0324_2-20121206/7976_1 /ASSEMBLY_ACC=CAM_ASM_000836 /TAXON_ID=2866 /ORGANISM="Crypthecodinium cohnii, Strain Seligo" /LENGTH=423 /DNA_ID=CAMNT_0053898589 /DNA_START=293 /DNA_END=1564 /DNA_ORIENTATION=-